MADISGPIAHTPVSPTPASHTGSRVSGRVANLLVPLAVLAILVVMLTPIPAWLMDALLTLSIGFSLLILLAVLLVDSPLRLSTFPTILLLVAMVRLALNIASTRLILTDGSKGPDAAGEIIYAFGALVGGGNFVVGVVVFAILVIINFVVITRGAGRIAEVAARFTLDALPGKQAAVDADLATGLITDTEARARRARIEAESRFFGAMDGAAKFVRGDAVAGVLITLVNIVGGFAIAVAQNGMTAQDALATYTLLTIGDGLASQIPALIVSVAAGVLISSTYRQQRADAAVVSQLGRKPEPLAMVALLLLVLATVPGIPAVPFLGLAGAAGGCAYTVYRRNRATQGARNMAARAIAAHDRTVYDRTVYDKTIPALRMDRLRLELGQDLWRVLRRAETEPNGGGRHIGIAGQIADMRRQLAEEFGFVLPMVPMQMQRQLGLDGYRIMVKEMVAGESRCQGLSPDEALVALRSHMYEVVRSRMAELLSLTDTCALVADLPADQQVLVQELIPGKISYGTVRQVLQLLLAECVSVRDLPGILDALMEAAAKTNHPRVLVEYVRSKLSRQLSQQYADAQGRVHIISLAPEWEQAFLAALVAEGEIHRLTMAPADVQHFATTLRTTVESYVMAPADESVVPVIAVRGVMRAHVQAIAARVFALQPVLALEEIHANTPVVPAAMVAWQNR